MPRPEIVPLGAHALCNQLGSLLTRRPVKPSEKELELPEAGVAFLDSILRAWDFMERKPVTHPKHEDITHLAYLDGSTFQGDREAIERVRQILVAVEPPTYPQDCKLALQFFSEIRLAVALDLRLIRL